MSIRRYASYNLAGAIVPLAVSLVTVPLYLKVIGLDRYGVLAICWVLVGYFGLFELGLGPATSQKIAEMNNQSPDVRSETLWGALCLSLLFGIGGGLLLLFLGGRALTNVRGVSGHLSLEIGQSLLWIALLIPLSTWNGVLSGALQGREQFLKMNIISGTGNVLVGVTPLLAAVLFGPELRHLIAAVTISRLGVIFALLFACRSTVPLLRPRVPALPVLRSLLKFGSWISAAAILTPLLMSAEKFAIGWIIGAAAVSIYIVPYNIAAKFLVLPQSLASALFPRFAILETSDVDRTEEDGVKVLCAVITPLMVIALAVLAPFLTLWVGRKIGEQSAPIGAILLMGAWFNSCSYIPHARLQGRGRPDLVTKISLAQILPYLLILYLSIRWGGLIGAAVVWAARMAIETQFFFAVTGQPKRLMAAVWQPALVILISGTVALAAPLPNVIGTILFLLLLVTSGTYAIRRLKRQEVVLTNFNPHFR